jgi:hypothetical protein
MRTLHKKFANEKKILFLICCNGWFLMPGYDFVQKELGQRAEKVMLNSMKPLFFRL